MTTFTIPFAFYGTATIEAEHQGEARLTIAKDLRNALADECSADLDNGGKLTFTGFDVDAIPSEPSAPVIAVGDAVALLRQAVAAWGEMLNSGGEINGGDSVQWLADFVANAANVLAGKAPDARHSVIDADLAEAAGDDFCLACERPSLDCSRAPCAAVIADREA